jgi:carotenoid 1,2-hydratase
LIAFIGSVFSPYYAWANNRAPANPENFCAMNIVLYEKRGSRWAMTERGRKSLSRAARRLQIGPSALQWENGVLQAQIDEVAVPIPRRVRGCFRLTPQAIQEKTFVLDGAGRHRWRPIAPKARIEVAFKKPDVCWSGQAYFDTNHGDAPLAEDFSSWHWSRREDGQILYDVRRKDGSSFCLALQLDEHGVATGFTPPPEQDLPGTLWRVPRRTRADAASQLRVVKTLEDAPFYARSIIESRINGQAALAVHESLSLQRFSKPWVRLLLPFRMPRW